ncbi:MAG TPA: response regulator transcription factor [Acidimicrobiales bacterium]|nr:response regulator transcription factor [Acidimicrobiales bacterium]
MTETSDDLARPLNLLIVEDHELLAGTLALALRQRGHEVETAAESSVTGIAELARRLAPVLVLLDLELGPPLGNGKDLVAPLVEVGARVLMVTGVIDRARLGECIEAGAIGVASKTAGFEALVDSVGRAARGDQILRDNERQDLLAAARLRRRADSARLAPFASLTHREKAVLARLVAGESAETIADKSYVSLATVRTQIRAILLKLDVNSQLAAVALAREAGWPTDE